VLERLLMDIQELNEKTKKEIDKTLKEIEKVSIKHTSS
jgi:hypothetical protein